MVISPGSSLRAGFRELRWNAVSRACTYKKGCFFILQLQGEEKGRFYTGDASKDRSTILLRKPDEFIRQASTVEFVMFTINGEVFEISLTGFKSAFQDLEKRLQD